MRYFILAVAVATLVIYFIIGLLWLITQAIGMFAIIIAVVALGAVLAMWEEKSLAAQWRKDMGYEQEDI